MRTEIRDSLRCLYGAYPEDAPLLRDLGLHLFADIPHAKWTFLGKHKNEQGAVKVWVECWPAKFWKFEIFSEEDQQTTVVRTGSGAFRDYWPMVEKIRDGMFVVKDIRKKAEV